MHVPVLLNELIELLDPKNNEIIVDATINGGGHAEEILRKKDFHGIVIGIDQDENLISILKKEKEKYIKEGRLKLVCGNFRNIDVHLKQLKINGLDGVLFDLGMSSRQLEEAERGFSFLKDKQLLMTFKVNPAPQDLTAEKIVNDWNEKEILKILKEYGEEKFAKRIAIKILETRKKKRIKTTFELIEIIKKSIPYSVQKKSKIHPATKTFQALRITVNDELKALKEGLEKTFKVLNIGGRTAVISFHSLEDRIVKNFFRDLKNKKLAKILTKKPIIASKEEIERNPRSRSAKLRAIIKI